jgi:replicative DNA helicase
MTTIPFSRQRQVPLPTDLAKKLPSNLDAERSVLGAILLDNASFKEVAGYLHVDDFFLPQHSLIFEAMQDLALARLKEGKTDFAIDLVTLTDSLTSRGKLDEAGGAPYLAALADGMPRVSNIRHYAKLVIEKKRRRNLIHLSNNIQARAFDDENTPDEILENAETSLKELSRSPNENPSIVIGFQSLLTRECAPIEYAIDPLLSCRGTGEIFGSRGTGKSFIATQMAVDIATGAESLWGGHRGGGGHWTVSRPFKQLYVYGEMDESLIQKRIREIAQMRGVNTPTDEQLGTMCMDYQKNWRPKLSTARDRKFIEERIFGEGFEALWLDNLSTLWPSSQDNEGERDAILADWYADLNQRGIWVIWLHHAGKSGLQRGGSEKEDMLGCVLELRRPANYKPEQQLRVEVHVGKTRGESLSAKKLMPFEIQLIRNGEGKLEWVTRPALAAQRVAAFEMFKNQMPAMLVGQEVGISRATAYRWWHDFKENPDPEFHTGKD